MYIAIAYMPCDHFWFFGQLITFLWPFMGALHIEHFGWALVFLVLGPWFSTVKILDTVRNKIKITQQPIPFISQFCLILPGFVGGTSSKGILSRSFFFFLASLRCCFSSMVFIGGGVRSVISFMAFSSVLPLMAPSVVWNISST